MNTFTHRTMRASKRVVNRGLEWVRDLMAVFGILRTRKSAREGKV